MTSHLIRLNVKEQNIENNDFGRNKRRKKNISKRNMNKIFRDGGIFVGRSGQVKQT